MAATKYKKIIWAVVAAAAVLAALALAVVLVVDPESYRGVVTEKAQEALKGRQVEIGPMSLDLWPGVGLEIKGLTVKSLEKDQPPVLSADRVVTRVALIPLLRGRLRIKSIEVDSPIARLVRIDQHTWNVSDLIEPKEQQSEAKQAPAKEPEKQAPAGKLEIQKVEVRQGEVRLEDRSSDTPPMRVLIQRLEASDILAKRPAKLSLELALADTPGKVTAEGEVGPLTGDLEKEMQADLEVRLEKIELANAVSYLPEGAMPILILGGELYGSVRIKGDEGGPLEASPDLAIQGLVYTDTEKTWPENEPADLGLTAKAMVDLAGPGVKVEPATIKLPPGNIAITADYEGGAENQAADIRAQAKWKDLDIEKLLAMAPMARKPLADAGLKMTGPARGEVSFMSKGKSSELFADLDMESASLEMPDTFVKPKGTKAALSARVLMDPERINLQKTGLSIGPLQLNGGGAIMRDKDMTADLSMQSGPTSTSELIALLPVAADYNPGGAVSVSLGLKGTLKKTESLKIEIKNLSQDSEAAKFDLKGSVQLADPLLISFLVDAENMDLDRLLPGETLSEPSKNEGAKQKQSKEESKEKGEEKEPADLSGIRVRGELKVKRAVYKGMEIKDIQAKPKLDKGVLDVQGIRALVHGSPVAGSAKMDLSKDPLSGEVNVDAQGVPVQPLINRFSSYPSAIKGNAFGQLSLSFSGTDAETLKQTASGKGDVKIKQGAVMGVDMVDGLISQWAKSDAVRTIAKNNLSPAVKEEVGEETPFQDLVASFNIAGQKIVFDQSRMQTSEGDLVMDGHVGLDGAADLGGKLRLTKKYSRELMAEAGKWVEKQTGGVIKKSALELLLEDGRLVLPFSLEGKWPDPALKFDAEAYGSMVGDNVKSQTLEDVVDQVIGEENKEKAKKEMEKAGKKFIEDLFPE